MSGDGLIYLVRHGEAAASWGEDPDPPLSENGQREAADAAAQLQPLLGPAGGRLLSSPLLRARQTAEPLASALACEPLIDERFREIPAPVSLERRQQWLRSFMRQRWSEQDAAISGWRDGMMGALRDLAGSSVVFTHFLVINTIVGELQERDETLLFWPANGSITTLERRNGALAVVALGEEMRSRVN